MDIFARVLEIPCDLSGAWNRFVHEPVPRIFPKFRWSWSFRWFPRHIVPIPSDGCRLDIAWGVFSRIVAGRSVRVRTGLSNVGTFGHTYKPPFLHVGHLSDAALHRTALCGMG